MKILTVFVLVVSAVTVVATVSTPAAFAQTINPGLETADPHVHNTPGGFGGQQDVNFHTGTCQGGHTTTDLNGIGGCGILQSPSDLGSGHAGTHNPKP